MSQSHAETGRNAPQARIAAGDRNRRPTLGPAIVSGGCAVMVAFITGLFNWVNRPPAGPTPPTSPPTLSVEQTPREPTPMRTASLETPPHNPAPALHRPSPIYSLNFAAFQSVVRDTGTDPEVRRHTVERVVGNAVMWQGYVARVVPNDPTDRGFIGTVVMVEDPILVTQTLQPYAAYCRFSEDPQSQLAHLQPGQLITIRGDCTGHTVIGTEIENCHLSEVTPSGGATVVSRRDEPTVTR